jgi:Tfp pilus assembly protein PilN
MININLLPEQLRRPEPTPLPLALTFLVGLAAVVFLGLMWHSYQFRVIPGLNREITRERTEERRLREEEAELQVLRRQINAIREHVDAVRTLYRGRTVWARILSDIKHLVTEDEAVNNANPGQRYLWLNNIAFRANRFTLRGYASASNSTLGMPMHERLLHGFYTFAPTENPEAAAIRRIEADLEAIRYGAASESPDFVSPGEREAELRRKLEEIRRARSGGIALMPFLTFIKPGAIRDLGGSWVPLPQPRRPVDGSPDAVIMEQLMATFPSHAWRFGVEMELAPPPDSEE